MEVLVLIVRDRLAEYDRTSSPSHVGGDVGKAPTIRVLPSIHASKSYDFFFAVAATACLGTRSNPFGLDTNTAISSLEDS